MTQFIGYFNITTGTNTIPGAGGNALPSQGMRGLILSNESGYSLNVQISGAGTSKGLGPGLADFFPLSAGFNGTLTVIATAKLSNISVWPSSFLQVDAIGVNEDVNLSVYPMALPRTTNGEVNFVGGQASTLVNDNSLLGSLIIETRVVNDISSQFQVFNNGQVFVGSTQRAGKVAVQGGGTFVLSAYAGVVSDFLMDMDTNGVVHMSTVGPAHQVEFDGNNTVIIDAGNGSVNISNNSVTFNGSTSGTVKWLYFFQGSGANSYKKIVGHYSNFRNGGAAQNWLLPVAFVEFAKIHCTDIAGISLLSSSVAQSLNVITAIGTTASQTTMNAKTWADCLTGFDTIQMSGANASAHSGYIEIEGV